MPALIAYLVALAVLLGGGYGGLYVLTHPSSEPKLAQAKLNKAPAKKTAAQQIAERRAAAGETETPDAAVESESVSNTPVGASASNSESSGLGPVVI